MNFFIKTIIVFIFLVSSSMSFEMLTGRGVGMGMAGLLSASKATTLVNLPSGGIRSKEWKFETGFSRRFELSDLDLTFFAVASRFNKVSVAIGAWQFGNPDLFAEQVLKVTTSYQVDSLFFGVTLSAMQVQLGDDFGTLRVASVGLGFTYRLPGYIISLSADDLTKPRLSPGLARKEASYQLSGEFIGGKSYSITSKVKIRNNQTPKFSIGQLISLSHHSSFFWGFSTAPFEFGGGLDIAAGPAIFTYATRAHPVLGFTHTVSISYLLRGKKDKKDNGEGIDDFD